VHKLASATIGYITTKRMKSEYKIGKNKRKGTKAKNTTEVDNITIRRCNDCKKVKPLEEFRSQRVGKSGFGYVCADCTREHNKILMRNYRENNPAYVEWARENIKNYNNTNREEINRKARERNKTEKFKVYNREYAKLYYRKRVQAAKGT